MIKGLIRTNAALTAQATCPIAWGSPLFAEQLHEAFLCSIQTQGKTWHDTWTLKEDFPIFLQRFSVNAIGFFGELSYQLGERFCPEGVDEEEYITGVLPILTGKPGRLVGDTLVAHFSYFTQEAYLLQTNILERYAVLAGLRNFFYPKPKRLQFRKVARLLKYNAKYLLNEVIGYYLPSQRRRYFVTINVD